MCSRYVLASPGPPSAGGGPSVRKNLGSFTGDMYRAGCLASAECKAVVPAFGTPAMKKSGRATRSPTVPRKPTLFRAVQGSTVQGSLYSDRNTRLRLASWRRLYPRARLSSQGMGASAWPPARVPAPVAPQAPAAPDVPPHGARRLSCVPAWRPHGPYGRGRPGRGASLGVEHSAARPIEVGLLVLGRHCSGFTGVGGGVR